MLIHFHQIYTSESGLEYVKEGKVKQKLIAIPSQKHKQLQMHKMQFVFDQSDVFSANPSRLIIH